MVKDYIDYYSNLNLHGFELRDFVVEVVDSQPPGKPGRVIYNSDSGAIEIYNGKDGRWDTLISNADLEANFTAEDKEKLNGIAAGAQVNVIESITIDGVAQTVGTGKAVALDLSKYLKAETFDAYKTEMTTALAGKVDKVDGMGLSSNDYTSAEKTKLSGIEAGAQVNIITGVATSNADAVNVSGKVATIDMSAYALKSDISSAVNWKGTKPDVASLPTGAAVGDMYHVTATGAEYIWNGTAWENVGTIVDASAYYTKEQTNSAISTALTPYATTEAVTSGLSGKVDKTITVNGHALSDNVTITAAELGVGAFKDQTLAGLPISTATQAALDLKANAADMTTALADKVDANEAIVGGTKCKITYDSKGLVTGGADLAAADIPALDAGKITSGTLAVDRIPALDASKITTGTLGAERIPALDASKVTTGVFDAARIPIKVVELDVPETGANTEIALAHGLTAAPAAVTVKDATGNVVYTSTKVDATNVTLVFGMAVSAGQFKVTCIGL